MKDKMFYELSENEQESFFLSLLKPDMKATIGKRSLNEVLGASYNLYDKTLNQIKADIKNNA